GFTGLWTALALKEAAPGTDVVVLEKDFAGHGASGRNAGILGETIDHSHPLAIAHFGKEEAQRLAHLGQRNLSEIAEHFCAHNIDCNLELSGRLYVALTPAHLEEAKLAVKTAAELGITGNRLLSKEEIQAELHGPLFLGGLFAPGGGILHPIKLIDGLKRVAL